MPCFSRTEYNLKKQDPEPSSGRQQGWHTQTRLGVIIVVTIIITMINRINEHIF